MRMLFPSRLIRGTLVQRYKRFLADVRLPNGDIVVAEVISSECDHHQRNALIAGRGRRLGKGTYVRLRFETKTTRYSSQSAFRN